MGNDPEPLHFNKLKIKYGQDFSFDMLILQIHSYNKFLLFFSGKMSN